MREIKLGLAACVLFAFSAQTQEISAKTAIGADFYINNNFGMGTFLPEEKRDPLFYSIFYTYPYVKTPDFWGDRFLKFYGEIPLNIEWLDAKMPSPGKPKRTPVFGELLLQAKLYNALVLRDIGFTVTPKVKIEIPTSSTSIASNKIMGLGAHTSLRWRNGDFFIDYRTAITGYFYSLPHKSEICAPYPNIKPENLLSDGRCIGKGQQTLAKLENSLYAGFAPNNHTVTVALRLFHDFLRQTQDTTKGLDLKTISIFEYAYKLPTAFPATLYLGVTTSKPTFDDQGALNFPFLDYKNPESNSTEFYLDFDFAV